MEQLALFAPKIVRRHGLREFHTSPYVSHGKRPDGSWGPIYRVPAEAAWQYPEIELRTPLSCPVLLFDCDRGANNPLAAAWADVLPFPSWICWRSETQTCHAAYCLRRPVLTHEAALPVPQQALARISEYFTQELRADPGYTGVLTHNPVHPRWQTDWGHQGGYSLAELGQFIPPGYRMPRLDKRLSIEGRNTGLFRAGMKWCGRPRNWATLGGVEAYLAELNQTLVCPYRSERSKPSPGRSRRFPAVISCPARPRRISAGYRPPEAARAAVSLEPGVTRVVMKQSGRGRPRGFHGGGGIGGRPNSPERAANSSGRGRLLACRGQRGIEIAHGQSRKLAMGVQGGNFK